MRAIYSKSFTYAVRGTVPDSLIFCVVTSKAVQFVRVVTELQLLLVGWGGGRGTCKFKLGL